MITLLSVAALALVSCLAAAGLIASAQNSADATRSLGHLRLNGDEVEG